MSELIFRFKSKSDPSLAAEVREYDVGRWLVKVTEGSSQVDLSYVSKADAQRAVVAASLRLKAYAADKAHCTECDGNGHHAEGCPRGAPTPPTANQQLDRAVKLGTLDPQLVLGVGA